MKLFRFGLGLALVSLVALAACHSSADKTAIATTTAGASAPAATKTLGPATAGSSPGASYAMYRGQLPGQPDSNSLYLVLLPPNSERDVATLQGSLYASYHDPDGEPRELLRQRASADSLVLSEETQRQPDGNYTEVRWRLRRLPDGSLTGTRAGQPLRLRRARPAVDFAVRVFADSVAAFPGGSKRPRPPYGHVSLQTLVPAGGLPSATLTALAANVLRQSRGDTLPDRPVPALATYWQQEHQAFVQEYCDGVADLTATADPADTVAAPNYALRYESQASAHVLCQQANLLSVGFFDYDYSGGAHGYYSTRVVSFDLRTGRPLGFDDIFRPGARTSLLPLLTRGVRRTFGLKPTDKLDTQLFDNKMKLTTNVCLTPGGALFVYHPYEIASYAEGEIRVFVPLRELRPLLREGLPLPAAGDVAAAR